MQPTMRPQDGCAARFPFQVASGQAVRAITKAAPMKMRVTPIQRVLGTCSRKIHSERSVTAIRFRLMIVKAALT